MIRAARFRLRLRLRFARALASNCLDQFKVWLNLSLNLSQS